MTEWKIQRRAGSCTACENPFADGERHLSTLALCEGELLRADLCTACWEGGGHDTEPLFWWFTRHVEGRRRTVQLDLASLEELFCRLEGREETSVRELRYVLCLLLMRKRCVKLERIERSDGAESFLVKRPRRDERFRVYAFDFSAERMAEIREELQSIFEGVEGTGTALEPGSEPPSD